MQSISCKQVKMLMQRALFCGSAFQPFQFQWGNTLMLHPFWHLVKYPILVLFHDDYIRSKVHNDVSKKRFAENDGPNLSPTEHLLAKLELRLWGQHQIWPHESSSGGTCKYCYKSSYGKHESNSNLCKQDYGLY